MKILIYSHDSYGLGHIRRSLSIAEQVASDFPDAQQLLLTGSAQSHSFKKPDRLDYVKLPSISKFSTGGYCSGSLGVSLDSIMALREEMIFSTAVHYKPDLFLVDKAPAGIRGELLRSLNYLKSECPETKLVLGMRDIEDDAMMVREEWKRGGVYPLLEDIYDAIFLYGSREVYDPVCEYGLSAKTGDKMISCGYIGRKGPVRQKDQVRNELKMKTDRLIVVTAGGGGDGFEVLSTYLEMLSSEHRKNAVNFDSLIVTGPLMSEKERHHLKCYERMGAPLTMIRFTPDMVSYLNAADLVISMGGYNSFCEILSLNKRAIIIPRVKPRLEQLIRAECFFSKGLVGMIHPESLTPEKLLKKINSTLEGDDPVCPRDAGVGMEGSMNASRAIGRFLAFNENITSR